ncbi:MAG TPA: PKD domain-containing protein, partial [Bacteroidota bacterium]|nr:PKD domain-containing protein [Bacteroidota bacterium]
GSIAVYNWNFGDGSGSSAANPSHVYASPGIYPVTLTITDNVGATGTSNVTVTVARVLRSTAITLSTKLNLRTVVINGAVTVKDGNGSPVPDAQVLVTWTLPGGGLARQSGLTDNKGEVRFSTSGGRGTFTLTIDNITKFGYTFDRSHSVLTKSILPGQRSSVR